MNYNESNPVLRRMPVYLENDLGEPIIGATPAGAQIQVSKSGALSANGAGSFFEVSDGNYVYQATQAESQTKSYILLIVTWPGAITFPFVEDIGNRIASAEPDFEARRIPIYLETIAQVPVTGVALIGAEVQLSIGGGAFVNGAGVVGESGFGGYFYEATIAEVTAQGLGVLKVDDPAAMLYAYAFDVIVGAVAAVPAPVPLPFPVTFGDPEFIDHVASALDRLPTQFRGML